MWLFPLKRPRTAFSLERSISSCPKLKLPGDFWTDFNVGITCVPVYKATPPVVLIFFFPLSSQYVHKTNKAMYHIHWGCIVKYELLTTESITILTKKKKRATQNAEKNLSNSAAAQTQRHGVKRSTFLIAQGNIRFFPAKQTLWKNSWSSIAHLSVSVTAKIWSGKITTYTVLLFISQRYHSTSKLREPQLSFLLSSAGLPAPRHLLYKCLHTSSLLHLYIVIDSALLKSHIPPPILSNSINI